MACRCHRRRHRQRDRCSLHFPYFGEKPACTDRKPAGYGKCLPFGRFRYRYSARSVAATASCGTAGARGRIGSAVLGGPGWVASLARRLSSRFGRERKSQAKDTARARVLTKASQWLRRDPLEGRSPRPHAPQLLCFAALRCVRLSSTYAAWSASEFSSVKFDEGATQAAHMFFSSHILASSSPSWVAYSKQPRLRAPLNGGSEQLSPCALCC